MSFLKHCRLFILIALLTLMGACGADNPSEQNSPEPVEQAVTITSPASGAQIGGNVVAFSVETAAPHEHFYVYLDQAAVAPGETIGQGPGIVDLDGASAIVTGLSPGLHKAVVVLGDGKESRMGKASAEVEFNVTGPSVKASAPLEAAQATGFKVEAVVEGIELVTAAKDKGGPNRTGHLHFIVDPVTPPTANGQPIPDDPSHIHTELTSYQVSGLAPGEHTVWVVVGDKNHVPFNPLVADRVTVTVK